jgi:precorrin-6B methylase 2
MRERIPAVFCILAMIAAPAGAQQYQPTPYQAGKDVVWVPTPEELVAAMLDMAGVTPADYVIDLGSGDGRIVIAAAKRGARALGIEYNPDMVELSKNNALKEGVAGKATFVQGDIFEADFSQATVLTMYLLSSLNMKLRPKILEMKPGTRVVSHAFDMEDWEPDRSVTADGRTAYLWIVPAKVEGVWTWRTPSGPAELTLRQTFQKIGGSLRAGAREFALRNAKLEGDRISFSVDENPSSAREYSGRVQGNVIAGVVRSANGAQADWRAERRSATP